LAFLFVLGLIGLIVRETNHDNPLINFRTLKDRNFCLCCAIIFCTFAILYSNTVSLPALLQSLFGYDATSSGLVLSPAGFFAIITLAIVGRLLGRGIDARYLMALGLAILAAGGYWMSRLNLDISPWQIVWPRVVFIIGLSAIFAPLNVAAFINIPPQLRGAAIGLLALLRNEGGSVGTSLAQTIQERRDQFHVLRLGENLDPLNPALNSYLEQAQPAFLQQTGDPVAAKQMALQSLANLRDQQSLALSYFDTFLIFALVAVALIGLVFLMKRAVAAKGAHVAAE
jgi:DHA2 family multidrug resistance protein